MLKEFQIKLWRFKISQIQKSKKKKKKKRKKEKERKRKEEIEIQTLINNIYKVKIFVIGGQK